MKKIYLAGLLIATMALFALSEAPAYQEDKAMTNAELVNTLFTMLKLEMPPNSNDLSDAERFKLQSSILAKGGIAQFVNAESDAVATRSAAVDLFYATMDGPPNATTEEKIDYVAAQGYMFAGGGDDPLRFSELDRWQLSKAVAEAYTTPEETGIKEESRIRRFFRNSKRRLKSGISRILRILPWQRN